MPFKPITSLKIDNKDTGDDTSSSGGKTAFSRSQYMQLVQFFRDNPEPTQVTFIAAGEAAGCSTSTAKRAWQTGWTTRVPPMHPIRELLTVESEEARAMRTKVFRELKHNEALKEVAVIEDGARVRLQEGLLVQATRSVAGKTLGQALKLANAAEILTGDIAQQLQTEYVGKDQFGIDKKSVPEKLQVLKDINALAREASKLATVAMELERKYMGQPEKIIGVEDMNVEKAIDELVKGMDELRSLRGKGGAAKLHGNDPEAMLLKAAVESLDVEAELASLDKSES